MPSGGAKSRRKGKSSTHEKAIRAKPMSGESLRIKKVIRMRDSTGRAASGQANSRQDFRENPGGFYASKLLIEALEGIIQFAMIKSQRVQDGGMQVTDLDWVFSYFVAEIVGLTESHARFYSAASQPDRKGPGI